MVGRRNALAVSKEVGKDELAGQRLRFRDRAARYREAARHIVAVRVRDGVGVAAVRKRRGVFALERAHGGSTLLDGDRVAVFVFCGNRLGDFQIECHCLAGKLLERNGLGNVLVRDLDRARRSLVAEGRSFVGIRARSNGIFAVRTGNRRARRVLEGHVRICGNGRKLERVQLRKHEVLEPDAVLAAVAAGVLPEGQQLLFARLKREAHLRPFGLIVLCGAVGVAAKHQIVVARFGVGLVPEADISGRCVILQLDGNPDLGVAHVLALGLECTLVVVIDKLFPGFSLVGIIVAERDLGVRTKRFQNVRRLRYRDGKLRGKCLAVLFIRDRQLQRLRRFFGKEAGDRVALGDLFGRAVTVVKHQRQLIIQLVALLVVGLVGAFLHRNACYRGRIGVGDKGHVHRERLGGLRVRFADRDRAVLREIALARSCPGVLALRQSDIVALSLAAIIGFAALGESENCIRVVKRRRERRRRDLPTQVRIVVRNGHEAIAKERCKVRSLHFFLGLEGAGRCIDAVLIVQLFRAAAFERIAVGFCNCCIVGGTGADQRAVTLGQRAGRIAVGKREAVCRTAADTGSARTGSRHIAMVIGIRKAVRRAFKIADDAADISGAGKITRIGKAFHLHAGGIVVFWHIAHNAADTLLAADRRSVLAVADDDVRRRCRGLSRDTANVVVRRGSDRAVCHQVFHDRAAAKHGKRADICGGNARNVQRNGVAAAVEGASEVLRIRRCNCNIPRQDIVPARVHRGKFLCRRDRRCGICRERHGREHAQNHDEHQQNTYQSLLHKYLLFFRAALQGRPLSQSARAQFDKKTRAETNCTGDKIQKKPVLSLGKHETNWRI